MSKLLSILACVLCLQTLTADELSDEQQFFLNKNKDIIKIADPFTKAISYIEAAMTIKANEPKKLGTASKGLMGRNMFKTKRPPCYDRLNDVQKKYLMMT